MRKELAFALFFIIFLIPFVVSKPLISEVPTDLSYRSGLEVKTEYRDSGAGLGGLLSETNYYYEFHPITPQVRQNINPVISCSVPMKGKYCPSGYEVYKEATDGYTLSDLEYRQDFVDTNSLYWRAYAAGFKTYIDIDYSLASYLSSKAVKSIVYQPGNTANHQDTFSQVFYDDTGSVIAEANYGKVSPSSGVAQTFLSHSDNGNNIHNQYRGFTDTGAQATTTEASSLESYLTIYDSQDQSSPKIASVSYAPDSGMIFNGPSWDMRRPGNVKSYEDTHPAELDIEDSNRNLNTITDYYDTKLSESYGYTSFFSNVNWNSNGNKINSITKVKRMDESSFVSCSPPNHYPGGFICPPDASVNGVWYQGGECDIGKPSAIYGYDYNDLVVDYNNIDRRTTIWDDTYLDYDQCGNAVTTRKVGSYFDPKVGQIVSKIYTTNVEYEPTFKTFPVSVSYYGDNAANIPLVKKAGYSIYGAIMSITDENNQVTRYNYDDLGRLKDVSSPDGGYVSYTYYTPIVVDGSSDERWKVKVSQKQSENVNVESCYIYDFGGRLAQTQLKDSERNRIIVSSVTYDALGRQSKAYKPINSAGTFCEYQSPSGLYSETQYDSLGRVTKVIFPDENFITTTYGSNSVTVADEMGSKTSYYYDGFGNLERVTDDSDSNFYATYDFYGNVKRVSVTGAEYSDYELSSASYPYAPTQPGNPSLPKSISNPEEGATSFVYDMLGNVIMSLDSEGIITVNDYDTYARISKTTSSMSNNPGTKEEIYFYYDGSSPCSYTANAKNRICKTILRSYADGNEIFFVSEDAEYDIMGRVKTRKQVINDEKTYVLKYGYDLAGNMIDITYPDNKVIRYAYNSLNQMESVSYTNPDGTTTTNSYLANPTGTLEERKVSVSGADKFFTTYSYDKRDLLTSMFASKQKDYDIPGDANDNYFERTYGYDSRGNLNQIYYDVDLTNRGAIPPSSTPSLTIDTFNYDNLNRLTGANYKVTGVSTMNFVYTYDALGNRKTLATRANAGTPVFRNYDYSSKNVLRGFT